MFVIYDKDSTRLFKTATKKDSFDTERAAKSARTRGGLNPDVWLIADYNTFVTSIEKKVQRVNLMTNQPYMESVNTPGYMSPASESYWSM